MKNIFSNWFGLFRIKQWIKNSLIVVGFVFAKQFTWDHFVSLWVVFFAFCFVASSVYIMNDMIDYEQDRKHTRKKNRPIASGLVSKRQAAVLCGLLFILSLVLASLIGLRAVGIIIAYFSINVVYTFKVKHIAVLDVFFISAGFVLRLLMGTFALGFFVSKWFVFCSFMLTLFLGFSKRKAELMDCQEKQEYATHGLPLDQSGVILDIFIAISAGCAILSYGLFTILASDSFNQHLFYTIPIVVYGLFRYINLVYHFQKGQDTSADFFEDWHLIGIGVAWLLSIISLSYF
jgi:4-hydroxybenzoate polyprenyltransferase